MKSKLCTVVFAVLFVCLLFAGCGKPANESEGFSEPVKTETVYILHAHAYSEQTSDEIEFVDENGNVWVCQHLTEPVNQDFVLAMSDNGTPDDITDDVILAWR